MKDTYSYYTKFTIVDEASIDDFWSYAVFRLHIEKSRLLYDRFAILYNILLENKFTLSKKVELYLYETNNYFHIF